MGHNVVWKSRSVQNKAKPKIAIFFNLKNSILEISEKENDKTFLILFSSKNKQQPLKPLKQTVCCFYCTNRCTKRLLMSLEILRKQCELIQQKQYCPSITRGKKYGTDMFVLVVQSVPESDFSSSKKLVYYNWMVIITSTA